MSDSDVTVCCDGRAPGEKAFETCGDWMINGMKMIRTNMPDIKKAFEILDLRL